MVQVLASVAVDSELLILIGVIGCTDFNGQKLKVGQALILLFVAAVFHSTVALLIGSSVIYTLL